MKLVYLKTLGGINMTMTIISLSLTIAEIIIGIIVFRKVILMKDEDDYNNVKVRLIFLCILMLLFVLELILKLISKQLIKIKLLAMITVGIAIGANYIFLRKRRKQ